MSDGLSTSGSDPNPFSVDSPDGLDFKEGLERCMNDADFYRSLLREFRKTFRDSPGRIEALMDKGDWKEAEKLAHSLKGTAGMVSASQVFASATALDVDLKAARDTGVPPATVREKLHALKQAMARLIEALNQLKIQD